MAIGLRQSRFCSIPRSCFIFSDAFYIHFRAVRQLFTPVRHVILSCRRARGSLFPPPPALNKRALAFWRKNRGFPGDAPATKRVFNFNAARRAPARRVERIREELSTGSPACRDENEPSLAGFESINAARSRLRKHLRFRDYAVISCKARQHAVSHGANESRCRTARRPDHTGTWTAKALGELKKGIAHASPRDEP